MAFSLWRRFTAKLECSHVFQSAQVPKELGKCFTIPDAGSSLPALWIWINVATTLAMLCLSLGLRDIPALLMACQGHGPRTKHGYLWLI